MLFFMRPMPVIHAPLLLPAVCLSAGIAAGCHVALSAWPVALLLAVVAVALLFAGRWPVVQHVGVLVCSFVLGMLIAPSDTPPLPDGQWAEAVVAAPIADRPQTVATTLLLPATGEQRRCYIRKDERSRQLAPGDDVLVCFRDHQFVSSEDWQRGGHAWLQLSRLQRVRIRALSWRSSLLQRLRTEHDDGDAEAVVAAMTLGDKSALTRQLRDTYSTAGASHVLALSGLHIGIIYMLLTLLTLGRRRFWLTQLVVLTAVWGFALLTGLSASVVRSAVMVTLYSAFALGGRSQAPLGVLSFTAIVMLLCDSSSLFDVGFQLSFLSMLGILLFMPVFRDWVPARWLMSHRLLRWLLGLMAVSVAAQLGTMPLVAYYFGHFPTYFLLTNLVVVPLATLIVYSTVAALLLPALSVVVMWLAGVLNGILTQIASWPLASIEGLHPSLLQVAMMYAVVGVVWLLAATYSPARARYR